MYVCLVSEHDWLITVFWRQNVEWRLFRACVYIIQSKKNTLKILVLMPQEVLVSGYLYSNGLPRVERVHKNKEQKTSYIMQQKMRQSGYSKLSRCLLTSITPNLPIMSCAYVALIEMATVFSRT